MAKFENAKVGDRVFSTIYGWGEIIEINKNECYALCAKFPYSDIGTVTISYTFDGRASTRNKYPTLFWNEFHIPTEEEDKKPFNLVEFLRENLEPKEFVYKEKNIFLNYDYQKEEVNWDYIKEDEIMGTVHFKEIEFEKLNSIINEMNIQGVTPQQLKEAYRVLKWL